MREEITNNISGGIANLDAVTKPYPSETKTDTLATKTGGIKPYARFTKRTSDVDGILEIVDHKAKSHKFRARSGQAGYQDVFWVVGLSPIPPSDAIQGSYNISLAWQDPTATEKLSMGSRFYPINPNTILSKSGTHSRAGIGIHYDANFGFAPGSAGCIAIQPRNENEREGWQAFMDLMDSIFAAGFREISLLVNYNDAAVSGSTSNPIKPEHWAEADRQACVREGLIADNPSESLNRLVTRGEMLAMINRLYNKISPKK
jgi:hypothetical protein